MTGYIHYFLPGVFVGHPDPQVNGALWTVPWEIICYVVMSGLIITQAVRRPLLVAAIVGLYIAGGIILQSGVIAPDTNYVVKRLYDLTTNRGAQALTAFLFGILAYQLRFSIPKSKVILAVSLAGCVAGALLLGREDVWVVWHRPLLIPALAYITVFIGLTRVPIPSYFKRGDYSYGIYLYHIPLLQIILMFLPSLKNMPVAGPVLLFIIGMPFITLFATGSWHWIEKPILGLRKKFSFVARARGIEVKDGETIAPEPIAADKVAMAGSLDSEGSRIGTAARSTT